MLQTATGPKPGSDDTATRRLDAVGLLALLKERLPGSKHSPPADPVSPEVIDPTRSGRSVLAGHWTWQRAAKIAVGVAVVAVFGWHPARQLLHTTSIEAVINAPMIVLRAPIDGVITQSPGALTSGTRVAGGSLIVTIANPRADRARLDDLVQHRQRLVDEKALLSERRAGLTEARRRAVEELQRYRHWRSVKLEARLADLAQQGATTEQELSLARGTELRAEGLAERRVAALPQVEDARRQMLKARLAHDSLTAERRSILVEVTALREGLFVGDGYNDRPASAQTADALTKEIAELEAEIADRFRRIVTNGHEIAAEEVRLTARAEARIAAPTRGIVWEVLSMPGEAVKSGQELVRIIDCAAAVVTATVTEQGFNKLFVGAPVRFRLQGEARELPGQIVHLTGVAAAPANLAIAPSALVKEPYRVTVAIPALAAEGRCLVGRTGRVVFDLDAVPGARSQPASQG